MLYPLSYEGGAGAKRGRQLSVGPRREPRSIVGAGLTGSSSQGGVCFGGGTLA
jgi:hypothetical protein